MPPRRIIPDRAEFIDALRLLRRGHVLVRTGEGAGSCVLDGAIVWHSLPTLLRFGLIAEFDNPHGFASARYYRLTPHGRVFADKACAAWRQRPAWQRLALRFVG